MDTTKI